MKLSHTVSKLWSGHECSTAGQTDGQTDGRTDGRTDTQKFGGYNIIPRHFLWRGIITGVCIANLLGQLRTAIHEKRRGKLTKDVFLQQDKARVHTCKVSMGAVERNGYELIPHPAYSPDLAPSEFFQFPNLKKDIRGGHFRSDEEVVMAVEEWVNGKDPDFFSSGLMAFEHRWS